MPVNNERFLIKVNEFLFTMSQEELQAIDIMQTSPTEFHLIKDHHSVTGKVREPVSNGKKLQIEIEGEIFEVEIKSSLDQMLEKMGFGVGIGKRITDIKAPMPGLVLKVFITEGQEVKDGEPVLILEAMKMENSIILNSDAKIKKIHVRSGQAVEKGQVLVEFE